MKRSPRPIRSAQFPFARCLTCGAVLAMGTARGEHSRMPRHGVPVKCAGSRRRIDLYQGAAK